MELLGLEYFIDGNKRLYYVYILSSLLIAVGYLYFNPQQRRINCSIKLWLHPSAKLDYTYFFISNIIKLMVIYPLVLSTQSVALWVVMFLSDTFGYMRLQWSYSTVMVVYTLSLFIISDFTRYIVHRLLHTVPLLWEFHKVHHSAKVMTPITFYRVHPIENILFGFRYALCIGSVTGVFIYFFGSKVGLVEIIGVNAMLFVFSFLGSNLRHSHIKLYYPKICERLLISPYMHQIHHSTTHYNKNFGGYLSIWDNCFNTIAYSKEVKKVTFGIKKSQMKEYDSVAKLLLTPIVCITNKYKENLYEIFKLPHSASSYFNNWM